MNIGWPSVLVTLPSGNEAVYIVQPQHIHDHDRAIKHGLQLAHEKDGKWYMPGGWEEIRDPLALAIIKRLHKIQPNKE